MRIKNIVTGWAYALGWLKADAGRQAMAVERQRTCAKCPFSKTSKWLDFEGGVVQEVSGKYCKICSCPVIPKSLVKSEECPLNKWKF